jgi:SOS-response transcriptional repressor LexA
MRPIHVQSGAFRIQGKVVGVQRVIGHTDRRSDA